MGGYRWDSLAVWRNTGPLSASTIPDYNSARKNHSWHRLYLLKWSPSQSRLQTLQPPLPLLEYPRLQHLQQNSSWMSASAYPWCTPCLLRPCAQHLPKGSETGNLTETSPNPETGHESLQSTFLDLLSMRCFPRTNFPKTWLWTFWRPGPDFLVESWFCIFADMFFITGAIGSHANGPQGSLLFLVVGSGIRWTTATFGRSRCPWVTNCFGPRCPELDMGCSLTP